MSEHSTAVNNGGKRKCGDCFWHEPMQNGRAIQCWYNPPDVFPSGFVDNPKIWASRRACAHFQAITAQTKEDMIREGAAAAAAMVASGRIPIKAAVNVTEGPRGKRNS